MNRPFLFLALTTVIVLASGCSRSQAAPSVLTPLPTTSAQDLRLESIASPTIEVDEQAASLHKGEEASSGQTQEVATSSETILLTPQTTGTPKRSLNPLSDLLYVSQSRLMRWDPLTGQAIALAENVIDFAASDDGQVIVLLRSQKITANGVQQFDLDALNLVDQTTITLAGKVSNILQYVVSPDGSQVAYLQEQANGVTINLLPIIAGNQPRILGTCQPEPSAECTSLAWSPDSLDLLWSDDLGLWQASAIDGREGQKPQLIHPSKVQVKDPKGQNLEIKARLTDLDFGPSERFVLMKVAPLGSQVGWQAVFDRRSGLLAHATDTYVTGEVETLVKWQADGNLVVGHASEPGRYLPPFIHIWYVLPTNPELLVSGEQFSLYSDDFPFSATQSKSIPAHCLVWLTETQPNHMVFAIRLNQSDDPPVLFDLNLVNGSLTKLQTLPAETNQVLWSPDGIHALVLGGRNQIFLFSLKTGELTNLQPTISPEARQFVWMPPIFRK